MAAFALIVGKDGPKVTKSSDAVESANFTCILGHAGRAKRHDEGVRAFTAKQCSRSAGCGQHGTTGRWNFTLKWTPDETQFMGMNPPPRSGFRERAAAAVHGDPGAVGTEANRRRPTPR